VVRGGLKRVAWLNATMSAGLVDWLTAMAAYMVSSASGRIMVHNLGAVTDRVPCRIVAPLRLIVASVLEKVQVQSASHSLPMLRR
jgi:hypothetical protein